MRDAREEPFIDEVSFVFGFVEIGAVFFEMGFSRLAGSKRITSDKRT